ncbi:MAG: hypothetical protein KIT83_03500, partial [Bryobacterales bacterium]|nr:hypothetical protein [Bryobacterales bacterium]
SARLKQEETDHRMLLPMVAETPVLRGVVAAEGAASHAADGFGAGLPGVMVAVSPARPGYWRRRDPRVSEAGCVL